MPEEFRIIYVSGGEEREERWDSLERFRAWALAEGVPCTFSAARRPSGADAESDPDDWPVIERGRIGG